MISLHISVPQYLTSSSQTDPKKLMTERGDFLRTVRRELKQEIFYSRSVLVSGVKSNDEVWSFDFRPRCANDNQIVSEPSMHEWLIKRGDVEGSPFEDQMQIYVAPNVVLACEKGCHQELQFGEEGRLKCLANIKQFISYDEMIAWLEGLPPFGGKTQEAMRWIEQNWEK